MLIEQFHGEYIVIEIQAVNTAGNELAHVYSIIVKLGEGSAHFNVEEMLENLSSTGQQELADLFRLKYSPWIATDVESENRRLNQILQLLTCYLARVVLTPTTAPRAFRSPTFRRISYDGIRKWCPS
jgi:hypothetical protein